MMVLLHAIFFGHLIKSYLNIFFVILTFKYLSAKTTTDNHSLKQLDVNCGKMQQIVFHISPTPLFHLIPTNIMRFYMIKIFHCQDKN